MIDKRNGIPKYIQLKNILKEEIFGNYRIGDKFMTEREIMERHSVSCATVAHAMKELVDEGVVVRRRGGGTFVDSVNPSSGQGAFRLPDLVLNGRGMKSDRVSDPLGWFIRSEIQRGIINNYNGVAKILNYYELKDVLKNNAAGCAILVDPEPEIMRMLENFNGKYVLIDHNHLSYSQEWNAVLWEQLPGVYEGMKYLIDALGHRRIGMIWGASRYHSDRFAGYQIGLRSFNIPYEDELVVESGGGSENNGYSAMKKLLSLEELPSAVFVDTDIKAIGAISAIYDAGLKVPEDISILGYDDIPGADELDIPLTTIRVPNYEMGQRAAEMLKNIIESGKDAPSQTLFTKLVKRKSCVERGGG